MSNNSEFSQFNVLKDCRHGKLLFNKNDMYIGRSIDLYGEFSEAESKLFSHFIKPGFTVIDAGANIGAHTVFLAQLVGRSGKVYAFEPQRIIFQTLCANIALNSITNTFCLQQGLGEESGHTLIPLFDYAKEANFGGIALEQFNSGETVPITTIDSLELPRCDFIKMDVEGMESKAIKGAKDTINKFRPFMLVENDRREKSAELIDLLNSLNYRLYWFKPPYFNADNYFKNPENVFEGLVSLDMLCLPQEMNVKVEGLQEV